MRVLHISSGNMYGGVETFLATLAREAPVADMQPAFALCFEGRLRDELAHLGHDVHMLGHVRLSRPQTVLRARRALVELLESSDYDVVVCHQPWTCVVFASAIRAAGLPVVLWLHMASKGRHWLERVCRFTRPDLVVCNSQFTASCASLWLPGAEIQHVYCPVSRDDAAVVAPRSAIRATLATSPQDVVIVQVSRLEPFKGQQQLLAALSTLRDLNGWTCWIVGGAHQVGERAYMERLERLARDHGIAARVRFTGERTDIRATLAAADIYCQPNLEPEGFGLTFIEAMQAELPVVTTGIGGACEIVDGTCGVLTVPGDLSALAGALRRLLADASLRAWLGAEGRRRSESLCDASRQMRRIQGVLEGLTTPRFEEAGAMHAGLR